jgi:tRNA A37 methylthiotransferase MiaB
MQRQQKISAEQLKKKVGKRLPVIIDAAHGTSARAARNMTRRRSTATSISSRGVR